MSNVIIGNFGFGGRAYSEWGWTRAVLLNPVDYRNGEVIIPAGTEIVVDTFKNVGRLNDEDFEVFPDEYMLLAEAAN
jgi:hypothetical protein